MIIIRMQTYGLFFIFRCMPAGNVTGVMSGAETTMENRFWCLTLFLQQPSHNSNIFEQVNIRTRTDDSREVTQLSDIMQVTYFLTIISIFPICKRAFIEVRNGLYHLPISPISCTDMMLFAHQNGPFRIANRFFRHFCSHLTVTKNAISHFSVFYFASKSGGFFW